MTTSDSGAENAAVLQRLKDRGVDLTLSRQVEFVVLLPDQASAEGFRGVMEDADLPCEVRAPDEGFEEWDAIVTVEMAPTVVAITAMEDMLAQAAGPFDGQNDGWGFLDKPGAPA